MSSDSYALSKTLADLELLHIVACVKLADPSTAKQVYYNTANLPGCFKFPPLQSWRSIHTSIQAINGVMYELDFQLPFHWSLISTEILSYLLFILLLRAYRKRLETDRRNHELRVRALALENEMASDLRNRVKHDVASPITALKSIVRALSGVDPEIKDFLSRTVARTEEVFNQLQERNPQVIATNLSACIDEIRAEKLHLWKGSCSIEIAGRIGIDTLVLAHPAELKALISNLLNNAFEACAPNRAGIVKIETEIIEGRIRLCISDNGRGISAEDIGRIGAKGFSSGKADHQQAGAGLGLYNAIKTIRLWGGDLKISSVLGEGAKVELLFRAVS